MSHPNAEHEHGPTLMFALAVVFLSGLVPSLPARPGCSTLDVDEENSTTDIHDWHLPDPHGKDIDTVRSIRDDIHQRVVDLFDELSDDPQLSATAN